MTADEWFGDAQHGEVVDLHPVRDDVACGRCRHPRWMHGGEKMVGPCHRLDPWGPTSVQCRCLNFIEPDGRDET